MSYPEITSGVFTNIPSSSLYSLTLRDVSKVFLTHSHDTGGSAIYDSVFNKMGPVPYLSPIELAAGSYIIKADFSSSHRAISAYIPSLDSYMSLPSLTTGTYKQTSYVNFHKLMIKEGGTVFISPKGDSAKAIVYDENLNFVAHATGNPFFLGVGNFIVVSSYSGSKNGELNINIPKTMLADSYLSSTQVLSGDNTFEGSQYLFDIVYGLDGNDRFLEKNSGWSVGTPDRFFGGNGIDTAVYRGNYSEYKIQPSNFSSDPWSINKTTYKGIQVVDSTKSRDGIDYLYEVERLEFADKKVALDVYGDAGKVAKILTSVFGVASVSNSEYVGIGLGLMDSGLSYEALAALAIKVAGADTSQAVVNLLWFNLYNSYPTVEQAQPYLDLLAPNLSNVGILGVAAADHAAIIGVINLDALSQTGLLFI